MDSREVLSWWSLEHICLWGLQMPHLFQGRRKVCNRACGILKHLSVDTSKGFEAFWSAFRKVFSIILKNLETNWFPLLDHLKLILVLFQWDQKKHIRTFDSSHSPPLSCRGASWDQISGSKFPGASMCVWHLVCHDFLVFNHGLGKQSNLGHVRQRYDENLAGECEWEFGGGVAHIFCNHFEMVCFMEPLHYWWLDSL